MADGTIKITHHYDSDEDVLYISLADDEPTYTESVNDLLYIELGWFSGIPKGFRIMSPKANRINVKIDFVVKQLKQVVKHRRKELKQEENLFGDILKQQLPTLLAHQYR